jgi:nitroreductase
MEMLKLIQDRRSSRGPYDPGRPISKQDLTQILEAGRWTPTAHNMQNYEVIVVDDRKLLDEIGNIRRPVSEVFIRENYEMLSFSEEELRRKKVGILGTMFPPSWRTPGAKIEQIVAEGNDSPQVGMLKTSPVLLIVVYDPRKRAPASEGDFLGIMSLGCLMENMWLMAGSLGIGLQILSALSEGGMQDEIKRILKIPEPLRIAFTARLGYAVPTPMKFLRVRRDIADFAHRNQFGNREIP